MPEGPSIVILKEAVSQFSGKRITSVAGNSKEQIQRLKGQKILIFRSWGKHFLICFNLFYVRIHFLLFGSYRVNEKRDVMPRLRLCFKKGNMDFYACSVRIIDGQPDELYDWSTDVMSDEWNPVSAELKLFVHPELLVCDALLHQDVFAGSGNIIKNEVLFRTKIHPESIIGAIPVHRLRDMINDVRDYSFLFYDWKKKYVLRKNWLAHTKRTCVRCNIPLIKEYLGRTNRRTFYCGNCQKLYV